MHIVYYCKHCRAFLGSIDSSHVAPERFGFSILDEEEQADMISLDLQGDTTYVKTVCEHCETALRQHPELMLSQTPLQ